ncbi:MAG TPA: helix-turn-helix transcriptional regulator, partial [Ilumatobacteraceae bacterium]|nr:helix-turn-helix transcriptional regulator [Ilumatobacteraceae bacterium]
RDEVVVQVVARLRRLTRADDEIFRRSTNQLVVVASVADARGGEYLRERISDVLGPAYLVGADVIEAPVDLSVTSSDQFSTLESLIPGSSSGAARPVQSDVRASSSEADFGGDEVDVDAAHLPLMVFSLPDGYLQAANDAARALYGLGSWSDRAHVRDIANPADVRHAMAAMSALSSGATDSYRARRTLQTNDGTMVLQMSVRRLVVGRTAFAVALAVPADPEDGTAPAPEGPFSAALVAGTIRANGAVVSVSSPGSPMESALVAALGDSLEHAAHPDEADRVAALLESMRLGGRAAGALRILHPEHGWVVCQCKLFTIRRDTDDEASTGAPVVGHDSYAFVLSANVSNTSMVDRIARLERHIRRIGSEVSAADLELGARPTTDHGVTAALDALEPTARQRDIVERLARGQRVSSIASELFISRSTVRNHLAQVYRLAGVHSQDELLHTLRGH